MEKARRIRNRFLLLRTVTLMRYARKGEPIRSELEWRRRFAAGVASASSGAGREATTVDEGMRLSALADHCKHVLYGVEFRVVLDAPALRRGGSNMISPMALRCTARTCARMRAAWGRSLGCAPQPLQLVARDCALRSIP